jgi:hypothetical protein
VTARRDKAKVSRPSERVYEVLLRAYPRSVRDAYGADMARAFRDSLREERKRGGGWRVLAGLWARTLADLVVSALAARAERFGGGNDDEEEVAVNERNSALVGFVLLLAPAYFVVASALKYGLGVGLAFSPLEALVSDPRGLAVFNAVSPFVFLGGLVGALALNAYSALRLSVRREAGALVIDAVRLRSGLWNLAVIGASLLLLATLAGYLFLENFVRR